MAFPMLTTSLDLLRHVATRVPADQLDNPTPCSDWTVAQVLLHAAGDQHAWASSVSSSPRPAYNPFAPAKQLDGTIDDLIEPAIQAATTAWAGVDPAAEPLPTPLPPLQPVLLGQRFRRRPGHAGVPRSLARGRRCRASA